MIWRQLAVVLLFAPFAVVYASDVVVGAEQFDHYLAKLKGKTFAVVAHPASRVGHEHLLDFLLRMNQRPVYVFSPEHGLRQFADAGERIGDTIDETTQIPVRSLYGERVKPDVNDVAAVDIILFDLQDVGVRYFTYVSTLYYVLQSCAENHKKIVLLDRPNPNADYVDGPLLDMRFASFVGVVPIPLVYGLTMGELAQMMLGEGWVRHGERCQLDVIPLKNYAHDTVYHPPYPPSPNLRTYQAIRLYPSLALFEATVLSVGRGTDYPFEMIGSGVAGDGDFKFFPQSMPGARHPPLLGKTAYGTDLRHAVDARFNLFYLIAWHKKFRERHELFFLSVDFFDKLAGSSTLREALDTGLSEQAMRAQWSEGLQLYMKRRQRYLLYP